MWPWRIKMPTQNLLRLLLLLMLIVRIMLATVCYRFGSWRLVLKLTSESRPRFNCCLHDPHHQHQQQQQPQQVFELATSHARVTSIKTTKQDSEWVSELFSLWQGLPIIGLRYDKYDLKEKMISLGSSWLSPFTFVTMSVAWAVSKHIPLATFKYIDALPNKVERRDAGRRREGRLCRVPW